MGNRDRMHRLLLHSFGRVGWRRRALVSEFCQREQPSNSDDLEAALSAGPPQGDWLDKWDTEKILFFLKSQARHNPQQSPWPKVTSANLDPTKQIPEKNIWGKPWHETVARTKVKGWWKKTVYRLLPPVPRSEWELLKKLSLGQAGPEWRVPPRRAPASALAGDEASQPGDAKDIISAWDWQKYATRPIRDIERANSRRLRIYSGLDQDENLAIGGPAVGIHQYTARLWRRMYSSIWDMTAMIEKGTNSNDSKPTWDITWGGVQAEPLPATEAYSKFFEGTDNLDTSVSKAGQKSQGRADRDVRTSLNRPGQEPIRVDRQKESRVAK